jgi:putative ABC transport system permease protein
MLRHYLTAAFAKFARSPFTTAANVLTLALGLACFIAAYGIAAYWTSADGYHAKAERTFVIGQRLTPAGQAESNPLGARSTATLARYLAEDFAEIELLARVYTEEGVAAASGDTAVRLNGAFVDADFLRIFDLEFLAGDPRTALDAPESVVLSTEAAERLFGAEAALGQTVLIDDQTQATVTGVIAPVRQPSFMGVGEQSTVRFDMLGHWNLVSGGAARDSQEVWIGTQGFTFATLAPGASVEALNAQLPAFIERHMPEVDRNVGRLELVAFPVGEITTRLLDQLLFGGASRLSVVAVLLAFGALVLAIASVNYANLATAQATTRAKEIGMRKVLGAGRSAVMTQSWLEAFVLTLIALVAAVGMVVLARAPARAALEVDVLYFLSSGWTPFVQLLGLAAVVAVLAGAYPAFVMSGVRPARSLQAARSRTGPRFVAQLLVGVQFVAASFLLIMLTVTQLQRLHLERTALSPDAEPVVVLNEVRSVGVSYEALKDRLLQAPGVNLVAMADREPWTTDGSVLSLAVSPEAGATERYAFLRHIDHDFFSALSMQTLAGRTFTPERETAPRSVIGADAAQPLPLVLDDAMIRALGFADPSAAVGETVFIPENIMRRVGAAAAQPAEIIGVVETDVMRLGASDDIPGHMYFFAPNSPFGSGIRPVVQISGDNVAGALAAISDVWAELAPNVPVDIRFYDELFEQAYRQYGRVSQLFVLLAAVSFVIASIGLLGIAVHVVSRRRHEIGVRKVLGSTSLGVVRLLLIDFSKPALIANLLAWPLGYFAAQTYLSAFAHRIELTPAPFLISMAITLAIAWAAVIGEVLKAASVRPAEVLRHA